MTKIPNEYMAAVILSDEDRKRVKEYCEKYDKNLLLGQVFVDLHNGEICKEDMLNSNAIRHLLQESSSQKNSSQLCKVLMCIAKGFYWCSEEELKEANIIF